MDSNGNMYASEALKKLFEESEEFRPIEDMPSDAIDIEDKGVAVELSQMNRRARLVYFSERRRGATEQDALGAARDSYKP